MRVRNRFVHPCGCTKRPLANCRVEGTSTMTSDAGSKASAVVSPAGARATSPVRLRNDAKIPLRPDRCRPVTPAPATRGATIHMTCPETSASDDQQAPREMPASLSEIAQRSSRAPALLTYRARGKPQPIVRIDLQDSVIADLHYFHGRRPPAEGVREISTVPA